MSDAFIVRRGGSGGGGSDLAHAYAIIMVEYPVGSTLTCSNGTKTLKAGNTYGAWAFGVPSGGTWVVDCFDGVDYETSSKKTRATVEITELGQTKSIELLYAFYLFDDEKGGAVNTDATGGFTISKSSGSSCEVTSEHIRFRSTDTSGQACRIMTANALNMEKYSKICFMYSRTGTGKVMFGAAIKNTSTDRTVDLPIASVSTSAVSSPTIIECPISSTGDYYIGVAGRASPFDVTVTKMWLE